VKRRDLEKHLTAQGCALARHGSRHDVWTNPAKQVEAAVPRHRQIPSGTARAICKELGVAVIRKS